LSFGLLYCFQWIQVFVTHVESPIHFWGHQLSPENIVTLRNIGTEISVTAKVRCEGAAGNEVQPHLSCRCVCETTPGPKCFAVEREKLLSEPSIDHGACSVSCALTFSQRSMRSPCNKPTPPPPV